MAPPPIIEYRYLLPSVYNRISILSRRNFRRPFSCLLAAIAVYYQRYYFEKEGSDLFSGIVIAQIFNDIVLYCYAGNNKFYGTLKYIESDLKSFKNCVQLSNQSVELFRSINRTEENDMLV